MNLGMERSLYVAGRAGEINHHIAWIDYVHCEFVVLEPVRQLVKIAIRRPESLAELACAYPMMVVRGRFVLKIIQELLELCFLLRRPAQLEQHVLQNGVVGNGAVVAVFPDLWTSVATKPGELCIVDFLGHQRPCITARLPVGAPKRKAADEYTQSQR